MKVFVAVSLYLALVCDGLRMEFNEDWKNFKNIYNKKYRHALEDLMRRSVWEENVDKILSHNKLFELGMESFSLGLNEYADLTVEEFKQKMNGFIPRLNRNSSAKMHQYNRYAQLAEAVDWRNKNAVTEIKNQGQCGSCWAFSSTGALEAQHALKNGRLVSLSEQQLVDCSAQYGNHGCNGGFMDYAFQYIKNNHGIDTEESYPYEAQVNVCRFQSSSVAATVAGYVDIPKGDENALKDAVATVGPVSVAIDSSSQHFLLYQGGIFDLPSCSQDIDHAVLVVGYGTENGKDYWLVKNSWGTSWGIGGYIKMSRNKNNQCAIASWASYPTV